MIAWWLTPLALLAVFVAEVLLVIELRRTRREFRTSLNGLQVVLRNAMAAASLAWIASMAIRRKGGGDGNRD